MPQRRSKPPAPRPTPPRQHIPPKGPSLRLPPSLPCIQPSSSRPRSAPAPLPPVQPSRAPPALHPSLRAHCSAPPPPLPSRYARRPPTMLPPASHHQYPPSSSVPSPPRSSAPWHPRPVAPLPSHPLAHGHVAPAASSRVFQQVDFALPLLARIGSTEDKVKNSQLLIEFLNEQLRKAPTPAASVDMDGRLTYPGRKKGDSLLVYLGFPASDEDIDYCLEDTPGLSTTNFNTLKNSLERNLSAIRQGAHECVAEMETVLAQQLAYRVIPAAEVDRRLAYIVSRFCKARKHVLHKYRGYVRNRRWIENVATRQRRGCLSHKQNNILRLWLFSNFSNPYPDTPDKRRLIHETQLSMTQINNWLINARSRVWKPTVESMSGERIRKEMRSKEDRYFEHNGDRKNEFESDYFAQAAASMPEALHTTQHPPSATIAQQVTMAHTTHGNQTVNGSAGPGVEGLAEDGTWLAPQPWTGLDFPTDVNLNN